MPSPESSLAQLRYQFTCLSTPDEKVNAALSLMKRLSDAELPATGTHHSEGGNATLSTSVCPFPEAEFETLLSEHGVSQEMLGMAALRSLPVTSHALDRTPCAYVIASGGKECRKAGTATCSGCRLVRYCSQECQKAHWKIHAKDCRDPIRSKEWVPAWVFERRPPTFMARDPRAEPLSKGVALWGNMPAKNVLNVPPEDLASRTRIDLAFVASGDLRNVIRTINSLPTDYSGEVTCLLNDLNVYIVLRNLFVLQILGTMADHVQAADIALHLWYSAFVPNDYYAQLLSLSVPFVTDPEDDRVLKLGSKATLEISADLKLRVLCAELASPDKFEMGKAANELARVRFDPSRIDIHHRHLVRLEPSHRLSFMEYRRFGLVLPFGAHTAQFNTPNPFLFSRTGQWLLTDHAKPIEGWDIEDIVRSGKAHGTTREDLYGCLYFHVHDQLRAFADRLAHLDITFKLFNEETTQLARALGRGDLAARGLPVTTRFDRIQVSNIMDVEYVGVPRTIDAWGKFLKDTGDATLLGYFMNWHARQTGARPETKAELSGLTEKLKKASKGGAFADDYKNYSEKRALDVALGQVAFFRTLGAVFDNSVAFDTYLRKQGLDAALRRSGLKRRLSHTIVPHRLGAPLGAPSSALPEFKDKESYYLQSNVGSPMWSERFIEICRARA